MSDRPDLNTLISILKQDLPTLFEKDISYAIYSKDITFKDPVNRFKGKLNYRIIFWNLRFHSSLFFQKIYFDLHDVFAKEERTIIANWTVRGTLRLPWKTNLLFNGYSTYKINESGLIYDHVDVWDRKPGEILKQFLPNSENIK
jgi:hypothetical protein